MRRRLQLLAVGVYAIGEQILGARMLLEDCVRLEQPVGSIIIITLRCSQRRKNYLVNIIVNGFIDLASIFHLTVMINAL